MNKWIVIGSVVGATAGFVCGWKIGERYFPKDDEDDFELVMEYGDDASEPSAMPYEEEQTKKTALSPDKAGVLKAVKDKAAKHKEDRKKAKYTEVDPDDRAEERVIPGQNPKPDISEVANYTDYASQYKTDEGVVAEQVDIYAKWVYDRISVEDYTQTQPFYQKKVLAWYSEDGVLAGDDLEIVSAGYLGQELISELSDGDAIYIRVDDQETDYEIYAADGPYEAALQEARGGN